jgi:lipoprotein-releasing system permease protein
VNFSQFISKRIRKPEKNSFSATISSIAVGGVASGMFVLIISFAILKGFQKTIQDKIYSFDGHLQLTKYDLNASLEEAPIIVNKDFLRNVKAHSNVQNISVFSLKAGLIKTENEVIGVIIKGVAPDYDFSNFKKNIIEGRIIAFNDSVSSKEIIISQRNAQKLNLKCNDEIVFYFVQQPPRVRKLKVVGIYETGMEDFDESFIWGDIRLIRKINNWDENWVGGYDIAVKNTDELANTSDFVYDLMDYDIGLTKITDKYISVFDWLQLLGQNVTIFLTLITIVACFNMVSSLFIMVMERTNMIGLFKTWGASNGLITKIFFLNGLYLVLKGMLIGDLLAITFCAVQYYFKILPLDPENYYMTSVPIWWDWSAFLFFNLTLLLIMSLVLVFPSIIISRITPLKSIKFS